MYYFSHLQHNAIPIPKPSLRSLNFSSIFVASVEPHKPKSQISIFRYVRKKNTPHVGPDNRSAINMIIQQLEEKSVNQTSLSVSLTSPQPNRKEKKKACGIIWFSLHSLGYISRPFRDCLCISARVRSNVK